MLDSSSRGFQSGSLVSCPPRPRRLIPLNSLPPSLLAYMSLRGENRWAMGGGAPSTLTMTSRSVRCCWVLAISSHIDKNSSHPPPHSIPFLSNYGSSHMLRVLLGQPLAARRGCAPMRLRNLSRVHSREHRLAACAHHASWPRAMACLIVPCSRDDIHRVLGRVVECSLAKVKDDTHKLQKCKPLRPDGGTRRGAPHERTLLHAYTACCYDIDTVGAIQMQKVFTAFAHLRTVASFSCRDMLVVCDKFETGYDNPRHRSCVVAPLPRY